MFSKNQVIVFVVSFFITGFFLFAIPEQCFPGTVGCCINTETSNECPATCFDVEFPVQCAACGEGASFESLSCEEIFACQEVPQIPTLNQWGKIITMVVIGLFAVIGVFAMRRRSAVSSE